MAILTKFLQLLKPERNDYVDVEKHLSENYDKIDTKMEELSNSNDKKLDKGAVSSEYDTAKKIEDKIKTKLNQGNVPDVLNSAEKIIKALQGNTGIKFDENLLYLNDSGTKKKGYCYIDKLTDGIFECIQETTTTVNNATYFKNFSNKENSDRLSNLERNEILEISNKVSYLNQDSKLIRFGAIGIVVLYFDTNTPVNPDGFVDIGNTKYRLKHPVEIIENGINIRITGSIIKFRANSNTDYFKWRRIITLPVILEI